jgi:hypothetical protein
MHTSHPSYTVRAHIKDSANKTNEFRVSRDAQTEALGICTLSARRVSIDNDTTCEGLADAAIWFPSFHSLLFGWQVKWHSVLCGRKMALEWIENAADSVLGLLFLTGTLINMARTCIGARMSVD